MGGDFLDHFPPLSYNPPVKNNAKQLVKKWSMHWALLLVSLVFLCAACASDPKKLSPVVTQVDRIQKVLNRISDAYQARDAQAVFSNLDPAAKHLASVREAILQDFEQFPEATLSFVIKRVETEEASALTVLRWRVVLKKTSSAEVLENAGEAVFSWVNSDDPKLTEIRGGSPFGALARVERVQ